MKYYPLWCAVLAGVIVGCAEQELHVNYNRPLTSPGGQFSALPPTVQNSVRAQVGAADITYIFTDTSSGRSIYEFHFKNTDLFPPLYVASDGSILTPEMTVAVGATAETIEAATGSAVSGVTMSDLPTPVVDAIRDQRPTAAVDSIHRIRSGEDVFYEVFFKDPGHHPKLFLTDSGRVVQ
jgi:hypothetical protein